MPVDPPSTNLALQTCLQTHAKPNRVSDSLVAIVSRPHGPNTGCSGSHPYFCSMSRVPPATPAGMTRSDLGLASCADTPLPFPPPSCVVEQQLALMSPLLAKGSARSGSARSRSYHYCRPSYNLGCRFTRPYQRHPDLLVAHEHNTFTTSSPQ